jgi:cephalosporin-C deacetylase-like acetyl esterase
MHRWLAALIWLAALAAAAEEVPVKIETTADGFVVRTAVYTAAVNREAALTSLKIGEQEFLQPLAQLAAQPAPLTIGGLFTCDHGNWPRPRPMPGLPVVQEQTLRAEGRGWFLAYHFEPAAIELEFGGQSEGALHFTNGYPQSEVVLSLAGSLHRCVNPAEEGDLGWPVTRAGEPGDYGFIARNGAMLLCRNVGRLASPASGIIVQPAEHRLHLVAFNTYDKITTPVRRRLELVPRADLAYALETTIASPVPGHVFPQAAEMVFPVTVTAHYGHTLSGSVDFAGEGYVWTANKVTGSVPLTLTAEAPQQTVNLVLRPAVAGHYTGKVSVAANGQPLTNKRMGLVFQPERIPAAQPPADFDAFWESTLAELAKIPLDLELEEQVDKATAAGRAYKVKFRAWGGRWAWAWLYVPTKPGQVAGTVQCPPVSAWQPGLCQMANGELRIAVAIHGGDIAERPAKTDFDYMNTGITSRDDYMLRYSYSCLVRCHDILRARPECNGQIHVSGSSQGAGLSLVLAGLRPEVASVRGVAIALCRIDWTVLGLAKWGPACPAGADPKAIAEVVRYYDPANFAHRIKAPLTLGLGLFDFCAPAEGVFSAINALPKETVCKAFVDPYGGHFTYNYALLESAAQGIQVPRWEGSTADNKLNP